MKMKGNKMGVYYDGAKLPFGDKVLFLHIMKAGTNGKIIIDGKKDESGDMNLKLTTLSDNEEDFQQATVKFYKTYAKSFLQHKTQYYAQMLGVKVNRITIKSQKTRWGSCSSKGNINYNWKIILMPEIVSDYIVVHELCHLKQMNHSKEFWMEVERIIPDYLQRKEWLRKSGNDYYMY